jgi:hypothetical protein
MTKPPVTKSPGRTPGLPDAQPSPKQIDAYRRQLRQKANEGETLAIGLVLLIETLRGATSA